MTFKDMRLHDNISMGAVGGPGFSSNVVTLNSGFESRQQNWEDARCWYDISKSCSTDEERAQLIAFFRLCKGRVHSFRFKDWTDFTVSADEGVFRQLTAITFQLVKRYTTEDGTDDRDIALPYEVVVTETGSPITTLVDGLDYTLDPLTGIMTLLSSPVPAPSYWAGKFDVPCRFDIDKLRLNINGVPSRRVLTSDTIPICEVRYPE